MTDCPACGESFSALSNHWRYNNSHRPDISSNQHEIITGILMGDGSVNYHKRGNPYIDFYSIQKDYLKYVKKQMPVITTEVRLMREAYEIFNDLYVLSTRSLPELKQYEDWYSSGSKQYPENLELTPTVLKHWFCGDGTYSDYATNDYIKITCKNEAENKDKIERMFSNEGLPKPNRWQDGDPAWNVDETRELFDYMGEAIVGFKYKWPKQ